MALKKAKLLLTTEETQPNQTIKDTDQFLAQIQEKIIDDGFSTALTDETISALVVFLSTRRHLENPKQQQYRQQLLLSCTDKILMTLSDDVKLKLMADPKIFTKLSS